MRLWYASLEKFDIRVSYACDAGTDSHGNTGKWLNSDRNCYRHHRAVTVASRTSRSFILGATQQCMHGMAPELQLEPFAHLSTLR